MERITSLDDAKKIMGHCFIGPDEICKCKKLSLIIPDTLPDIKFRQEDLEAKKEDYLLILGLSFLKDGKPVSVRSFLDLFGNDPVLQEPCFYNQDWYLKESFIDSTLQTDWFMIRKSVFDDSRAKMPDVLEKDCSFPTTIQCVYAFFVAWLCLGEKLWWHDFVWCNDRDHNGDRIYVGKYHDVDGVNKNGFSIHRHLSLRPCYGAINYF